jgi:hypothetical protein
LIAIASIRLTKAVLDIPTKYLMPEPELVLYAHIQNESDDTYSYYNVLLKGLNSFCNALELAYGCQ